MGKFVNVSTIRQLELLLSACLVEMHHAPYFLYNHVHEDYNAIRKSPRNEVELAKLDIY